MTQAQLPEAAGSTNESELGRLTRSLAGKAVAANYTVDPGDNIVAVSTAGGNRTITLPAAALMQERFVTVKKTTVDGNTVTVTPAAGETIDGAATSVLNTQWQSYTYYSNGSTWSIVWVFDTAIPANVAAEAATRAAADSAEASTRASADSSEATARANADSLLQPKSEKNAASGYAGLDAGSKLTGSQQKYGAAANTACEGNDSRLSDSRAPTGAAGGDLAGTYPNPTLVTYGTFVTSITMGTSGTVTLNASFQTLSYCKIGRLVHVKGNIVISAVSAPVGEIRVAMPFTSHASASQTSGRVAAPLLVISAVSTWTGTPLAYIDTGVAYMNVVEFAAGTITNPAGKLQANTEFWIDAVFEASV